MTGPEGIKETPQEPSETPAQRKRREQAELRAASRALRAQLRSQGINPINPVPITPRSGHLSSPIAEPPYRIDQKKQEGESIIVEPTTIHAFAAGLLTTLSPHFTAMKAGLRTLNESLPTEHQTRPFLSIMDLETKKAEEVVALLSQARSVTLQELETSTPGDKRFDFIFSNEKETVFPIPSGTRTIDESTAHALFAALEHRIGNPLSAGMGFAELIGAQVTDAPITEATNTTIQHAGAIDSYIRTMHTMKGPLEITTDQHGVTRLPSPLP